MKLKTIKNQSGQGLLELVVAIGVITVGLFSVWNLFLSNFNGEQEAGARILAVNLAREGLEMVKNIRDSNWLAIENNETCFYEDMSNDPCRWDSGLDDDGSGLIKNIFSDNAYLDYLIDDITDDQSRLYIDSNSGFYSHNHGQPTIYRRLITMQNVCCFDADSNLKCDDFNFTIIEIPCPAENLKIGLDVKSTVRWTLKGQIREITVSDRLFNWK